REKLFEQKQYLLNAFKGFIHQKQYLFNTLEKFVGKRFLFHSQQKFKLKSFVFVRLFEPQLIVRFLLIGFQ
ncbi:MAG TPA: hypothetical protein DEP71_05880, partial [Porphyromonadaceae bacterium]|nr:hypothetical protein [Porphyromonadaceae bacterium]HBF94983.1 hypothetical protein [Porphyromonadaceae bacterium]HBK95603.1 hypothetical protein [Porphyromonadaceae bacterium]HBQ57567.1 hypothetical protein [Porphyromonadaceae bacterium]HBU45918.1 hypothetical protein [Porphyromonadaceae bacterium]